MSPFSRVLLRQLTPLFADFARSGIEILVEVMDALRQRDLLKNGFEV